MNLDKHSILVGRNSILMDRHLMFYKFLYEYSKKMYTVKFDDAINYRKEFLEVLNDLGTFGLFPISIAYQLKKSEYDGWNEFIQNNKQISTDVSLYFNTLDKLKKIVYNKSEEFKKKYYKPSGEKELNNQIFYNYSHYEIRDYAEETMNTELMTNAWLKMYDMLRSNISMELLNKQKKFTAFHICELPGAFIAATNHFVKTNTTLEYDWVAQSLFSMSNKNMLKDQYGMYEYHNDRYDFGIKKNGDIYDKENIKYYITKYFDREFFIITSDCGESLNVDTKFKEDQMWGIHWHQLVMAIGLNTNYYFGKLYSLYSQSINKLVMIASLFYEKVFIYRPYTTKITSDEIYLICKYKKSYDRNIWRSLLDFNINDINLSKHFCKEMVKYNLIISYRRMINMNFYMFILNNIDYIKSVNDRTQKSEGKKYIYETTRYARNYFIKNYVHNILHLSPIKDSQKLLPTNSSKFGKKKTKYKHDFTI